MGKSDHASDTHGPVGEIVERVAEVADNGTVRIGDIVEAFGDDSFLPVLIVPALLVVSPLSGIPLFSSICGLSIAFIAGQMVIRRKHLWLPKRLMRAKMKGEKLRNVLDRVRKMARWLDRYASGHLKWLMRRPLRKTLQILIMLCGLAMPFLEIVPFTSSILGAAVLAFTTALLTRDAIFALLGSCIVAAAVGVPLYVLRG
ncbi:Uncharacterized conserved protein [Poseidonocella pacifica]|uniref:Uncharacterized conserved protein n=1 Tax=Poseidonocella pacifica TaxID=871651 RepID=A0A1I0YEU3_9RHOB|nr:exopolysaccharide biosynthesis protein [Poseidonocella pacifica]SFB11040.1 Uncharacterized conserved protein [Poseidonocella pacifica]